MWKFSGDCGSGAGECDSTCDCKWSIPIGTLDWSGPQAACRCTNAPADGGDTSGNDNTGGGGNDNSGEGSNDNSGESGNDNSGESGNDNSGEGGNDNSGGSTDVNNELSIVLAELEAAFEAIQNNVYNHPDNTSSTGSQIDSMLDFIETEMSEIATAIQ